MDSKEGIEKVMPVDAQAAGLLDPSFLQLGTHDAAMADPPREQADSQAGLCVSLDEHPRQESNCLYVRVLRDSDVILEQDHKVPDYCWNAGISKDICEARTGVVPGTFSIDLLRDTEFLIYLIPKTRRGMSDHEARCYAELIMGSYLWAGSPATQARLRDLDVEAQKHKEHALNPVGRGRSMTRRAVKYLALQHGKEPEQVPRMVPTLPVFLDRVATLDDYHSAQELSESEYDTKETDPE